MLKRKVVFLIELALLPLTILAASIILSYSMLHSRDEQRYQISAVNTSQGMVIYRLDIKTGKIRGCLPKVISHKDGITINDRFTDYGRFDQLDFAAPDDRVAPDGKLVEPSTPYLTHQVFFDCSGFLPSSLFQ